MPNARADNINSDKSAGSNSAAKSISRQNSNKSDAYGVGNGHSSSEEEDEEDETIEVKMTLEELVSGSLVSTFWAMDRSVCIKGGNRRGMLLASAGHVVESQKQIQFTVFHLKVVSRVY